MMVRFIRRAALGLGVLLLSAFPAMAQDYAATWVVLPQPSPLGELTIKPGDIITQATLLPRGLRVLDGDAVGVDGKLILTAGAQMMILESSVVAACTFSFPQSRGLERLLSLAQQRFSCFVDEDGDGKFESAFFLISSSIGVPPPFGQIPKKRIAIAPVSFSRAPLQDGRDYPRLYFKYSHRDQITGYAYLGICIGNSVTRDQPCFDGYIGIRSDKLPKEVSVAGNELVVTQKNNELLTLTLKHGFEAKPFVGREY